MQYSIATDLNRCVGCLSCNVACKVANNVPTGDFWLKTLRIGPYPEKGGSDWPDVYMYYLTVQCQHCKDPECVRVCPTGASHKLDDGTVQIDKAKCIGCQFCVMACPYGVRYLNGEERVVEKCTMCEQKIAQGELPQCVTQCNGRARFFGDLDRGIDSFLGPEFVDVTGDTSYDRCLGGYVTLGDTVRPYDASDVHTLRDVGNGPSFVYILRDHKWKGDE